MARNGLQVDATCGSPTPLSTTSLVRTRTSEEAAAPQPASATTERLDGSGGRLAPMPTSNVGADAAMSLSLLSHVRVPSASGRNLSGATAHASRATDAGERRRLRTRILPDLLWCHLHSPLQSHLRHGAKLAGARTGARAQSSLHISVFSAVSKPLRSPPAGRVWRCERAGVESPVN